VKRAITLAPGDANIAIVSHGGVGALLKCHLRHVPIHRREDQPSQGHYFSFEVPSSRLRSDWGAIDAVEALE
jgi:broad specificity phosphatase PhoE